MSKLSKIEHYVLTGKEEKLIKLLKNKDHEVQLAIIDGLGKIGRNDACLALIPRLDDPDAKIRARCAAALGNIGDEHTITYLLHRMEHETDEHVIEKLQRPFQN